MQTIHVDSIKPTAKSLVLKSGNNEFFAKKGSGITQGMTIEAEVEDSDYNGKTYRWVKKWSQAKNGSASPAAPAQGAFTATGINLAFLPFVSNVVAHAIQCGRIETPTEIQAWADAAYTAASNLSDAWQK